MRWRPAQRSDLGWVEALLFQNVQASMFLIGNLREHGLGPQRREAHPHALTLWVRPDRDGVFGITTAGTVLMMAPDAEAADWRGAGQLVAGRAISAVLGDAPQVRSFLAVNDLQSHPCQLDSDDPGFLLDLTELRVERRADEEIIPLGEAPRAVMEAWRTAYEIEAVCAGAEAAAVKARADIAECVAKDSHRVLLHRGEPVAMTGFNQSLPEAVQVGGVYTPPALRGRGYARRVVGRHLDEARARGASRAVLFAASEAAARAYRAVGFQPAGTYALVLFSRPAQTRATFVEGCT
ncbi:GNAT family N-acetyltransferase [Phaeobacter sp. B1627]|uniref:GNAT family N-acetyltransferase n=1 Tax=Phaeobacter sp. B1627 TaxID=2583809 RepID=UPI001117DE08|nr:GNAT family N-acetyltransferase [Phaeobacter sp. B1627]TNJ47614.1 GNAT family N-acetyltransferase [Phaeobacter sp. B1627]